MKAHPTKSFLLKTSRAKFCAGATSIALALGTLGVAHADLIPYGNPGTINPTIYTFTAASSGVITAYFAGSDAGYHSVIGMLVNGVSTGITGLDNHTSTVGQSMVLGNVNAGDTLTFVLLNLSLGLNAYSNPSLNGPYDAAGGGSGVGQNHVYSTAYTRTSDIGGGLPIPLSANIPVGTYVGFEDIYIPGNSTTFPDYDYNDETFIFANVSTGVPDAASSAGLLGMSLAGIGLLRRRFCAAVVN